MPIEFFTSLDLDLVFARWWGVVDDSAVRVNFMNYLGDPNYRPGRPELIDLSQIKRFDIDFAATRGLIQTVNRQVPGEIVHTPTIVWAPSDGSYGMARMFQQLAEITDGIVVKIFRDERAALDAAGQSHESIADLLARGNFLEGARS
ncbi:hypothetical protein E4Z66_14195 [Aliishimia ponticola]|uniref:Uncharacterized protein n=1 Tax=Aliishimia ponticola TaxID=2499833 RepID=A0A4S4NA78_9RHOB|nr:hypothetical protein [Aliishimia ponticola]THH36196.1 hypothetical protein E4Z66_14195 [Aliishimia ponticola]